MSMREVKQVLADGLSVVGAHQTSASLAASTSESVRSSVRQLLIRGLTKLYAAHRQGAGQAAENSELAHSAELKEQLKTGTQVNLDQRSRLEGVFRALDLAPEESMDQAMQGIIDDNKVANAEAATPLALDLVLIDSGQIAAHFYMARYGTLHSYAETIGNAEAAQLLKKTLDETLSFDNQCTRLAHKLIVAAV